ncbi:MAG: hypothetical protein ISP73_00750 [Flavobacteriales bacterium]|nr:hypothetical protein [Flavobacteriales bacterium]
MLKFLKRGDINKISKLSGYNRVTINRWVNGKSNNLIIEKYLIALADKRQKEIEEVINNFR